MALAPVPTGLSPFHPAVLLATWGWSGRLPGPKGTWGSAAALPFGWLIAWAAGPLALIPAALLVFAVGIWAGGLYASKLGVGDPGPVVIDEVAGQWLTLALVPLDPLLWIAGFFLFRAADIIKPFPANWADRSLKGGIGIMTDDLIAGLYAMLVLWGAHRWLMS